MTHDIRYWMRLVEGADDLKQYHQKWLDNPAFLKWFVGSKIVDPDGDPLLVFHGSPVNIPHFEPNDVGGFFFTSNHNYAASHAAQIKGSEGGYLHPCFLSIQNPKIITPPVGEWSVLRHERQYIHQAKAEGHDGLILHSDRPTFGAPFYVAFKPSQIKSFNKTGRFDPNSPKIAETVAMTKKINLVESVSDADLTLYHGTDSAPFTKYDPSLATKAAHWNPLGSGMYATNSRKFAQNFGKNIHKIVLLAGAKYRKIGQRQWATLGMTIVSKALAIVFQTIPPPDAKSMGKMKWAMGYVLSTNSPFDSLLGCYQIVKTTLSDDAAQRFSDIVPKISDKTFASYDFVIFTDTINSMLDYDEAGKPMKAWEVVIFNKSRMRLAETHLPNGFTDEGDGMLRFTCPFGCNQFAVYSDSIMGSTSWPEPIAVANCVKNAFSRA